MGQPYAAAGLSSSSCRFQIRLSSRTPCPNSSNGSLNWKIGWENDRLGDTGRRSRPGLHPFCRPLHPTRRRIPGSRAGRNSTAREIPSRALVCGAWRRNARKPNGFPPPGQTPSSSVEGDLLNPQRDQFDRAIEDALNSLPRNLRAAISNVEIVVEDEAPAGQSLLGLYQGVPLSRRTSSYSGVLPDKISIFGGPITRLAGGDPERLHREIRRVVLHEMAHHFGISDERLIELDRY
jgi:predicted Zn-dependent protease with MMP-like domain